MSPAPKLSQRVRGLAWVGVVLLSVCAGAEGWTAEELRDPFLFWPPTRGESATTSSSLAPLLNGILWDVAHPLALIAGEPLSVGQTVAGWQLIEIQRDGIVVQRGSRRETILPGSPLPSD